jgi:hypothetical protein
MFSTLQTHEEPSVGTGSANDRPASAAALASTSGLLALGSDLKAYLEQPENVSIGEFAAVVERLHGEFQMICGETEVSAAQDTDNDCSSLFVDAGTRELSANDIGQIESILRDL